MVARVATVAFQGIEVLEVDELGSCRIEGESSGRRSLAFARDPLKQFQVNWSRRFRSRRPAGYSLIDAAEADAALAAIRLGQDGER